MANSCCFDYFQTSWARSPRKDTAVKIVLQRVTNASVTIDEKRIAAIGPGLLLLLGVHINDTGAEADFLADKCAVLRIFTDENGKMNRSLVDVGGAALVVSQFTLLGDCTKGRRPSFIAAAEPEKGDALYRHFVNRLKTHIMDVQTGIFGAMMQVELVNDGPVTLVLERSNGPTQGNLHP